MNIFIYFVFITVIDGASARSPTTIDCLFIKCFLPAQYYFSAWLNENVPDADVQSAVCAHRRQLIIIIVDNEPFSAVAESCY